MTYWLADEARASEARYNNDDRAHKRLVVPGYNTRSKRINRGTSHFSNLTEPHLDIDLPFSNQVVVLYSPIINHQLLFFVVHLVPLNHLSLSLSLSLSIVILGTRFSSDGFHSTTTNDDDTPREGERAREREGSRFVADRKQQATATARAKAGVVDARNA